MCSRPTRLSPLLRSLAALALAVFVVAQALCFGHCNFGGGQGGDGVQPSCHAAAPAGGEGEEDRPAPSGPTATCLTLKTMLAGDHVPAVTAPPPHTLFLPAPMATAFDAIERSSRTPCFRPAYTRDWVLTPEVCLGPAVHSLAPPSSQRG